MASTLCITVHIIFKCYAVQEPTTEENLQEQRSARRMKIMQRLGLIAPPDSPFRPKYMNQD